MDTRYYTNGDGRWWKTVWEKQCPHDTLLARKCQGVIGHNGHHWSYKEDGSFVWSRNSDDPSCTERHAGGITPPAANGYPNPIDKSAEYYLNFSETTEITDLDKIARLENGELEDGETATIDSPVTEEELQWLKDSGRLDEIIKEMNDEDD